MDLEGGKRRQRKTLKKRKSNNILKSWVTFVKKVQKDEKIPSYKDAIKRASQRKREWKRGMMGGMTSTMSETAGSMTSSPMPSAPTSSMSPADVMPSSSMGGGRKSRRRSRSRGRK